MRAANFGGLDCRVTGGTDREGGGDGPVVVLLHGFGAPGEDLVPLWRVLDVPPSVRFVFPAAPITLEMGWDARAWWRIDLARMERAAAGEAPIRASEIPAGLAEARTMVSTALDEMERGLGFGRGLYLGGFSQGAMLALDVALHTQRALAGLVLMSGTFIAEPAWAPRFAARSGLRAMMSHGREDPLLPYAESERLRDRLIAAGWSIDWVPFRGGHTIPEDVLVHASALIAGSSAKP